RRPPAHRSVSLRHNPAVSQPTTTEDAEGKPPPGLSTSPTFLANKQSSGESSDTGQWFENANHANNTASQIRNAAFVDNEPPFFLRNVSSASSSPPEGVHAAGQPNNIPFRPGMMRMATDGSSSDDLKGVVDDLTVANKKLRQKLKKYEKMHNAHLDDEKLFEVRFHGLPDHKKKELEEMLQKFAVSVQEEQKEADTPTAVKHSSSNLSRQPTDSAYASMSASGQNSMSAPSGSGSDPRESKAQSKAPNDQQQRKIHSYLHGIPVGLQKSSYPTEMSDASKKKLVVRRLEQLFAGKRSAPGVHPQPAQQEEVAQSAALADRQAREASGQPQFMEGLREAHIMPMRTEDGITSAPQHGPQSTVPERGDTEPDQRPTRPLDLDPFRAQVPAENMEYFRHLGFSLPDASSTDPLQDGHGWVYLNLLINMAQLHTVNVTPDYVKHALAEYSSKFELSHDGRKIRWKGGDDVTMNSDSSSEPRSGLSGSPSEQAGSRSRSATKALTGGLTSRSSESLEQGTDTRSAPHGAKVQPPNKLAYTPIFMHRQESDDSDDIYNPFNSSSGNSPLPAQPGGVSSALASSGKRSQSSRNKKEAGPVIFYSKARFCTDLSGDRGDGASPVPPVSYTAVSVQPLGVEPPKDLPTARSGLTEPRGPLDTASISTEENFLDGHATSSDEDPGFSLTDLRRSESSEDSLQMDFEVSGLGGILPEDNFSIRVKRARSLRYDPSSRRRIQKQKIYPKKIVEVLKDNGGSSSRPAQSQVVIQEKIISTSRKKLPSSALPPASMLPFDYTSSGELDSDLDSDISSNISTSISSRDRPRGATPEIRLVSPPHPYDYPMDDNNDASGEPDSDSSSRSSPHPIAPPHPRSVSRSDIPDYESDLGGRLSEIIPAGSSAATAGGGSGFNSPDDPSMGLRSQSTSSPRSSLKRESMSMSTSSPRSSLKRGRTNDSLTTKAQEEPSKSQR
ncbi:hypothetical protein M011DRAFT_386140, partial [Sporormia fimetaria CBS 119925]